MARTKKYSCHHHHHHHQSDPIYGSQFIQMINQRLMRHGKKKLAYRILQKSLKNLKNQKNQKQDPLLIIEKAIRNTTPSIKIQKRRIGGAVYPIPIELEIDQGIPQAISWILMAAKKRQPKRTLARNLAQEFLDASKKLGTAFYKKEELYKIADANMRSKNKKSTKLSGQRRSMQYAEKKKNPDKDNPVGAKRQTLKRTSSGPVAQNPGLNIINKKT